MTDVEMLDAAVKAMFDRGAIAGWWSQFSLTECADCGTTVNVKRRYENDPARCDACHRAAVLSKTK